MFIFSSETGNSRKTIAPEGERLLHFTIPGKEKDGRPAHSTRPKESQQENSGRVIQDGKSSINPSSDESRRLDAIHRFIGRISSHPHTRYI